MKIIAVIPARYKSSRFPGKPLIDLLGKPMIQWVAELTAKAVGKENVFIATENILIKRKVESIGFKAIMTSKKCLTGTDRVAEVAKKIKADIYLNIQGDEPLINPKDIKRVIDLKVKYPGDIINCYTRIINKKKSEDPNIPKVIFNSDKYLIYISRKNIPGFKDKIKKPKFYFKQVCIYAFNRNELFDFYSYGKKSNLEAYEDIEILRFFEFNRKIRLVNTQNDSLAVDIPSDIRKVEKVLKSRLSEKANKRL